MANVWTEGMGYMCYDVLCVCWRLGIYVCVCLMCELKAWGKCLFMSDMWFEGVRYICVYIWWVKYRRGFMCVSLMFKVKSWEICDLWGWGVWYKSVYVWCLRLRRGIYLCVRLLCELYAWVICVCMSDVWGECGWHMCFCMTMCEVKA